MKPPVGIITVSRRPWMLGNVIHNILRQTLKPFAVLLLYHGTHHPIPADFVDAMEDNGLTFSADAVSHTLTAGALTNYATDRLAQLLPNALLCKMDDDDCYGPDYLASMQAAYDAHPDAWLIGKSAYTTRYVDGVKAGQTHDFEGRFNPVSLHASSLAGPTFCIPSTIWNAHPDLRYPDIDLGCDGGFVQQVDRVYKASGERGEVPIYHVPDGEFFLQRYSSPQHQHAWNDPRDRQ